MKSAVRLAVFMLAMCCVFALRSPNAAAGSSSGSDDIKGPATPSVATAGQLIISEFRLRGPNGASDEFIEVYNASGADHTVAALSGTGYGIAASDGTTRCSIPSGTVIPNRGHYLCVNSVGYSLASYPAGNGTTATGDATYTTNIADNAGIAIFNNNSGGASYSLANRLDAVGSTAEANTLYKEGTGYPTLVAFSIDYSFSRDECGKGGSITDMSVCTINRPKDTNNNAADFIFNDTNGTSAGAGQRLGAPGPQNLSSPTGVGGASYKISKLDICSPSQAPPNQVRDFTSDPPNNSTFGTLDIRRTITNNTGGNVTRMKFRVVDLTTFPAPSGIADLRPRTSTAVVVTVDRAPCGSGTSNVTVNGTTLEQPPSQPNGGGFNSTLSAGTITLGSPLANGASVDVRFLFGIQQTGLFKLGIAIEALPQSSAFFYVNGATDNQTIGDDDNADFDGDGRTDVSIFRPNAAAEWWIQRSSNSSVLAAKFGANTDIPVPADYTGDGKTDIAFFRPSTGQWFVLRSNDFSYYGFPFGNATDVPAPADYDGDGKADAAVFRSGAWYILRSSDGFVTSASFGSPGDKPVPADYDGDMKADIGIWRPNGATGGEWWIQRSTTGVFSATFGSSSDKAAPGDWTGDGRADCAFYRPSNGTWYVLRSEDQSYFGFPFGISTDTPAPGDYDGDEIMDAAVFRQPGAQWYVNKSAGGTMSTTLGSTGDMAVPGLYVK